MSSWLGRTSALCLVAVSAAACGGTVTGSSTDAGPGGDGAAQDRAAPPDTGLPPPTQHRPSAVGCSMSRPPGDNSDAGASFDGGADGPCHSDSECTAGKNGRCTPSEHNGFATCEYDTCFTDADCGKDGVCECGQAAGVGRYPNTCLTGNCAVDSDCGSGGYCSPSYDTSCGAYDGTVGYYCHTPKDECTNDDQCSTTMGPGYCAWEPTVNHWACFYAVCAG
jgi:hypothetical protein